MLRHEISRIASVVLFTLICENAYACGPYAPNSLLHDRQHTLTEMPNGSFIYEARHLVERDPRLPLWQPEIEPNDLEDYYQYRETQKDTDYQHYTREKRLQEIAEKLKTKLPTAERLYYLGAIDFYHFIYDSPWFDKLLALPKSEQGEWRLKAMYTQARKIFDSGENDELAYNTGAYHSEESIKGIKLYQQIIEEVRNGEPDPEQLSLASLGQLGFYRLNKADMNGAITYYAQQAAQGSPVGKISLRRIALYLTNEKNFALLENIIDDPIVQKLVIAELFIRHDREYSQDGCITENSEYFCTTQREKLINLLVSHRIKGFSYSDRLAALAYRNGDYSLTKVLLEDAPESGLREWLNAKMALREGNIPLATRYYASAAKFFPENETWGNPMTESDYYHGNEIIMPSCRIAGEQAILALKRDDYLQAMTLFYKGKDTYWADLADVGESVLTLQELKTFVDKNVPPPSQQLKPFNLQSSENDYDREYSGYFVPPTLIPTDVKLRALLARRFIRNGQYQQAVSYFDIPNYRKMAQQLADLMEKSQNNNINNQERAQAQYEAARLLRYNGIELVAYEMYPDYAITSGAYSTPYSYTNDSGWISEKENRRFANAVPDKNNHFLHYRWQAAEWAGQSADLLHPKTQTWAAVLCHAASWVRYLDPETGALIYQRYVKNGKPFDWAAHFGRDCPEPVFKKDLKK
ncbi:hypothetical protein [Escherichia sp. E4385]|uniref:hypothetical protein n=1 Tax=Escherichia sp. E4385 TaxID=2040639 RepID=UPI0010FD26E2|nr:hypothetical protein [Escherichia sp. E4385]TLJ02995.1 hypothetical protein FEK49_07375 [Escherichia sp. E4385]